ncbi:MAG: NAD(P)-dependent alcohol dehydrogenase [Acidimicrobiia bacterium]|nr:NAD(P)-dependent alcohol dehydrogenase [Acidimicrobiia bacterium]
MRAYRLTGQDDPFLELDERADPQPGPGEVCVAVDATSLNYRDLMMVRRHRAGIVPLSDGAGRVVAAGPGVSSVTVGDLVAGTFFSAWVGGRIRAEVHDSALGGAVDGMLAERVVLPEAGVVPVPSGWTAAQAATLPCAALTAWNALVEGQTVRAGQTVVLLGTGGVSVFGLQLAAMFGARTVITSSSDAKLERMAAMGADITINYRTTPDWDRAVLDATGGLGADLVLEVGGAGTLERSIACTRHGGQVALIGILTGVGAGANVAALVGRSVDLRGVYVGSRDMFVDMNAAIDANGLEPLIDRVFPFDEAADAYRYLESQAHIGKVVIAH